MTNNPLLFIDDTLHCSDCY